MMKKLLLVSLISAPVFIFAQSTGFMAPTVTPAPNGGWTDPANAFASDDVYTTVPHQSGCRCPFVYLSWDDGASYTSAELVGPFSTTDNTMTAGSSSYLWGRTWTESEFANNAFRLKIANPSTLIEQGYGDFNFVIPSGATIVGIEVGVEQHGDAGFTTEYIDAITVNVYYAITTGINTSSFTSQVRVFPNPASTQLTIENLLPTTGRITLLDMSGRVALEITDLASGSCTLKLADLMAGMYTLVISDSQAGVLRKKIAVQ